tara:strand:+ start:504 stop:860 length:357 start_codon:yes stop_codon:yes gene_type:complete
MSGTTQPTTANSNASQNLTLENKTECTFATSPKTPNVFQQEPRRIINGNQRITDPAKQTTLTIVQWFVRMAIFASQVKTIAVNAANPVDMISRVDIPEDEPSIAPTDPNSLNGTNVQK